MLKYALFLFSAVAFSQVPAPPACLSGPVTQGSVTLSCSLIETDPVNGATDPSAPQFNGYPVFQVKLSTTDTEVVAFRVGVTYTLPRAATLVTYTLWGTVGKSPSPFFTNAPASATAYYRYTFIIPADNLTGANISGLQIQELKSSSAQSF